MGARGEWGRVGGWGVSRGTHSSASGVDAFLEVFSDFAPFSSLI